MKKQIAALLALSCLLLSACAPEVPEEKEPETLPVSSITTTNPDGSVQRMEQVYDENGIMIKANHYNNEKLVVSYNVTCDKDGRMLKMSDDIFGTGISMEYTYYKDGKTEKIETKLNGVTFFIQRYTYHENGEKATYTEEDLRSSIIIEYKYIYEEGVMRWEEYYENGENLFSWEYTYNADGKRIEGTKRDGNFMEDGSRKYTYDASVTTVTTYDVEGAVRSIKTIHYDATGNVEKETFTEDGETTVTEYTYRK